MHVGLGDRWFGRFVTARGETQRHADKWYCGHSWLWLIDMCLPFVNFPSTLLSIPRHVRCTALAATGVIWSRYATQIIPVNYNLLSVNLFVGATGLYQLYRIYQYTIIRDIRSRNDDIL